MQYRSIFAPRCKPFAVNGVIAVVLGIASGSVIAAPCVSGVPYTTVGANDCQIPAGVSSISVSATGGGGGGGVGKVGAAGAVVAGTISVTPGNTLPLFVGGGGKGFNGGAGGGGSSNVNAGAVGNQIIAGGGGGGSSALGANPTAGLSGPGPGSAGNGGPGANGNFLGGDGLGGAGGIGNGAGAGAINPVNSQAGGGGGGFGGGISVGGGGGSGGGSVSVGANMSFAVASNGGALRTDGGDGTITLTFAPATAPEVSVACSPSELTDAVNQVSTCTVTMSSPSAQDMSVNLNLPTTNPRYTTSCVTPVTVAANATSVSCTITAVANTTPNDGSVTAQLSVAPSTLADAYIVTGSPAQVVIKDDDDAAPVVGATPVPSLGVLGLICLSSLFAIFGISRCRKRTS